MNEPLNSGLLLRNAALFLLASFLFLPPSIRPLSFLDVVSIIFGSLLLFLMYLGISVLLANGVRIKDSGLGGRA